MKWSHLLVSLMVCCSICSLSAFAASSTVTTAADDSNATNSAVTCQPGSTTCTLRQALLDANAAGWGTSDVQEIQFDLTPGQPILLRYALPVVFVNLDIDGRNSDGNDVIVDGGSTWRIFLVGDDGTALPSDRGAIGVSR